jgi:hypothetical protein
VYHFHTLQEIELQSLFVFCLQKIEELITCNGKKFTKSQAIIFQDTLMVLCQFCIGGQRREFIVAFDMNVSISFVMILISLQNIHKVKNQDAYVFYPPAEKVLRVDTQEVPIPGWLGDLVFYFKKFARKSLIPKEGIQSLWINRAGKPLGNTITFVFSDLIAEYDAYSERITKYVASVFPTKHITPITFRRMIPTLMWETNVHIPGVTMEGLLEKYSRLVNTSQKVAFICSYFSISKGSCRTLSACFCNEV